MWNGNGNSVPSWNGGSTNSDVGNLNVIPPSPQTEPYVNPSLNLAGRNTVAFPTEYSSMSIDSLTVKTINGGTGPIGTWAEYPAITNVTAVQDNLGNPQYSISGFTDISGQNLYASNTVSASVGTFSDVYGTSSITVANNITGGGTFIVNGGTTLDGGTFHGTSIGSLPVSGVNTVRIDVLPIGIDIVSPTYVTINAAGAANIAAGGALSLAGGGYIEMNTSWIQAINTSSGNDNTLLTIGQLQAANNGSLPLRIGGTNHGVTLTAGKDVQSDLFRATNLSELQSYPITNVWNSTTIYSVGTTITYSTSSSSFGVGNVYICNVQNSNCIPANYTAPLWSSGTSYVIGNVVSYQNNLYRCVEDIPNSTTPPSNDLFNWLGFSVVVPIWTLVSNQLYNSLYFNTGSSTGNFWSLIAPVGTGYDGIYIVERQAVTNNLVAMGRLYDTVINPPPFIPTATTDLNMNGYNINNANVIECQQLNPIPSQSFITVGGYLGLDGNWIYDVGRLYVDELYGYTGSVINTVGLDVGNNSIAQVNTISVDSIEPSRNSNVTLLTDLNMNTKNIVDASSIAVDTLQSATTSYVLLGSNIHAGGKAISFLGNVGTNELSSGGSGFIQLMNTLNANSQTISNIGTLNVSNLDGNGGGAIELQNDIACNGNQILGAGLITTSLLEGTGGSGGNLNIGNAIDMNYNPISNVSGIAVDSISAYTTGVPIGIRSDIDMNDNNINNILGLEVTTIANNGGTNVLFHCDIDMNGNSLLNVANITVSGTASFPDGIDLVGSNISNVNQINVNTIQSTAGTNITINDSLDLTGNSIINVRNIYTDNITDGGSGIITLNANVNGNTQQMNGLNQVGTDNLIDGGSGNITLNANIVGNEFEINGLAQLSLSPNGIVEPQILITSDLGNDVIQITPVSGTDNSIIQNQYGTMQVGSSADMHVFSVNGTVNLDAPFYINVNTPLTYYGGNVNLNNYNIEAVTQMQMSGQSGTDALIDIQNSIGTSCLTMGVTEATSDSYIENNSGGNLYISSNASIQITASSDLIINPSGNTIQMQGNTEYNQNIITGVQKITYDTSYVSKSNTSDFYQVRMAPYTLYYNPDYWSYGLPATPNTFVPIASEWADFPAGRSYVDINNAYLQSVRYINQQTVRQPMIQRGSATTGSTGTLIITLPVAYTSTSYQVSLTYTESPGGEPIYVSSKGTSAFSVSGGNSKTFDFVTYGDAI